MKQGALDGAPTRAAGLLGILDRLDDLSDGRRRMILLAIAALGAGVILAAFEPFGEPGDSAVREMPAWDGAVPKIPRRP